jgi:dTDP-glucose 4,6-dehydratase
MARVLLTGAGGFIGSHALDYLLTQTEHEVVCIDSFRHKGKTDRIRAVLSDVEEPRVEVFTHDLTAPISTQLEDYIGDIDQIWNFASNSAVEYSISSPVDVVENNVKLILMMLEYARSAKPDFFFQVSTDEVYGPAPVGVNHKEWEIILPSNPYSASKAAQEAIAIAYWRTYGVPVVLTNTMNNIGEMQDREKFVPMLISNIYNGVSSTIHGKTGDDGSRFYLHAREHASALNFIANNTTATLYEDQPGEVVRPDRYNVVGSVELSNLELAKMIADAMDRQLIYELVDFHSTRPGHDRRYALDGAKLADMGWSLESDFQDSLERTIKWTMDHPEWMK